jgi:hypothetical protein
MSEEKEDSYIKIESNIGAFYDLRDDKNFKKIIFDIVKVYAYRYYEDIKTRENREIFPAEEFMTLAEFLKKTFPEEIKEEQKQEEKERKSEQKNKKCIFILDKYAKNIINIVIHRILFEIFSLDVDVIAKEKEKNDELEQNIIDNINSHFDDCSIVEIIIRCKKAFSPHDIITESYGLEEILEENIGEIIQNHALHSWGIDLIIGFLKLLVCFIINGLWVKEARQINEKNILIALRNICLISGLQKSLGIIEILTEVEKELSVSHHKRKEKNKDKKKKEERKTKTPDKTSKPGRKKKDR